MPKKSLITPNSLIKNVLHKLFMWSRERQRCLKGASCVKCGSRENLQCHHPRGIDWARIIAVIREELLPDDLQAMCKDCHKIVKQR